MCGNFDISEKLDKLVQEVRTALRTEVDSNASEYDSIRSINTDEDAVTLWERDAKGDMASQPKKHRSMGTMSLRKRSWLNRTMNTRTNSSGATNWQTNFDSNDKKISGKVLTSAMAKTFSSRIHHEPSFAQRGSPLTGSDAETGESDGSENESICSVHSDDELIFPEAKPTGPHEAKETCGVQRELKTKQKTSSSNDMVPKRKLAQRGSSPFRRHERTQNRSKKTSGHDPFGQCSLEEKRASTAAKKSKRSTKSLHRHMSPDMVNFLVRTARSGGHNIGPINLYRSKSENKVRQGNMERKHQPLKRNPGRTQRAHLPLSRIEETEPVSVDLFRSKSTGSRQTKDPTPYTYLPFRRVEPVPEKKKQETAPPRPVPAVELFRSRSDQKRAKKVAVELFRSRSDQKRAKKMAPSTCA